MSHKRGALALFAPIATALLVLSACGGSGNQAADVVSSASAGTEVASSADPAMTASYPLPDCTGQDPEVCAQDGFDPSIDGFNFANWGAVGELGATEMVALFGRSTVCTPSSPAGSCTLYPAASEWMKQANESMTGGHCEGMAVMAERLFLGAAKMGDFDATAAATYDLAFENPALQKAIDLWFTTQSLPDPATAAGDFRNMAPSQIAAEIAAGFQTQQGYTIGIYSEAGGHAVTPLAVTREGDLIAISIYDNNYPGTVQRIMVDPSTETWTYAMGSTNPDMASDVWSGTTGTMDLTPMAVRDLPEYPPFAADAPKGAAKQSAKISNVLITSADPKARVGVTATVNGKKYDLSDLTVAAPAGVRARPMLAGVGFGGGESITIDTSKVKSFSVSPKVVKGSAAKTPITMSIDTPTRPRVTLRSSATEGAESAAAFAVDARGRVTVSVEPGSDSSVNISNGLNGVEFPVSSESNVEIDEGDARGVVHVSYVDEDGNVLGTYNVKNDNPDGDAVDTVVEFDPVTGKFTSRSTVIEAEDVDEEQVQAFNQHFVAGADTGADAESNAESDSGSGGSSSSKSDSGANDDSGSDSGSGNESDAGSGSGSGGASGTAAGSGAKNDPGSNSGSGVEDDPEADPGS